MEKLPFSPDASRVHGPYRLDDVLQFFRAPDVAVDPPHHVSHEGRVGHLLFRKYEEDPGPRGLEFEFIDYALQCLRFEEKRVQNDDVRTIVQAPHDPRTLVNLPGDLDV